MRCDQIESRLDAFIDGELSAGEVRVLESHLEGCPNCGRELEARRALRRLFASRPRTEAPRELRDSILAAAGADAQGGRATSRSGEHELSRWRRARWPLAFAAAAALVLMFVAPRIGERESGDEPGSPFTTPARVVVPRFGESAEEAARVGFGGIDLGSVSQRSSR